MNFVESYFTTETFSKALTFAIFVVAGFDIAKYMPELRHRYGWIIVGAATAVAGYIAITTPIVVVLGYEVAINMMILGLGCGCVVGYVTRLYPRIKMR